MREIKGKKNLVVGIDIEFDFIDPEGGLPVPGAPIGVSNFAEFLIKNKNDITDIALTVDDHYPTHIGLAGAWWKGDHEEIDQSELPLVITRADVLEGKYAPRYLSKDYVLDYLQKIEAQGGQHYVWPDHCLRGSSGQAFPGELLYALREWTAANEGRHYSLIRKGYVDTAEMYSAFSYADGSCPEFCEEILNAIADEDYDNIFIAGFAKDFCVRSTLQDIRKDDRFYGKLILLDDCMASIDPDSEIVEEVWEDLVENFGAEIWKTKGQ